MVVSVVMMAECATSSNLVSSQLVHGCMGGMHLVIGVHPFGIQQQLCVVIGLKTYAIGAQTMV